MRKISRNKAGVKRLNIGLSERDSARLSSLAEYTNASSDTEVIKRALLTYEALVERLIDGAEFYVMDPGDAIPAALNLLIDIEPTPSPISIVKTNDEDNTPVKVTGNAGETGRIKQTASASF